jgi:subtilase family serine protease
MQNRFLSALSVVALLGTAGSSLALGQQTEAISPVPSRIVQTIDNTSLVALPGNVRRDLTPERDMGVVEDGLPIRLYLILKRSPDQQARLDNLIARQQQPGAAEYHKWLTPKEFGQRFGLAPEDIAKITNWLESQGFQVKSVLNNASMIDFQATAGGVRNTFHTQLHYWNVKGGKYAANAEDPQIPAALQDIVAGIEGLSKIPHNAHHTPIHSMSYDEHTHRWLDNAKPAGEQPKYSAGNGFYNVTPQDYYTIYNVNPIYATGNLGAGATISLPEPTDMHYGTVNGTTGQATGGDVATFRTTFGVAGTLNMTVLHGSGSVTCSDPGITDAEVEANLDAEWANAVAPSAHLIFMSCDSTSVGDGFTTALTALIDNNISDVISSSYGNSEAVISSSEFSADDTLASQAASQGQSFLDAAGDSGSADADQNTTGTASQGLNIDQFAAQPLITAVGGTDFSDLYDADKGGKPQTTYWGANSAHYGDALSYVPETPWNGSCASSLIAADPYYGGGLSPAAYCAEDPSGFTAGAIVGGGGGFSSHYAQPSYQPGTPGLSANATKRAEPDIAFFASNGIWSHFLLVCDSSNASTDCSSSSTFGGGGGTSFTAPQFAGVTALLVTATGERQGTLNPALYALGKAQFTAAATKTACYSNGQTSNTGVTTGLPASSCIFNDVTTSNNDEPCAAGSLNCYVNQGAAYGILSTTNASSLTVSFPATPQFDQATGFGSVNIYNMITNWNTAFASATALKADPTSITSSQSTTLTATVTGTAPTGYTNTPPAVTGSVNFLAGTTKVGSCTLSSGTCSTPVAGTALASGSNSVTATFVGSATYPSSTSSIVTVTVTGSATTATPMFNPGTGTYSGSVGVMITDATTGSAIYYTTDGSTPTTSSTPYTAAINVTATETIKAIAVASSVQSAVASATYTITASGGKVPPPIFTPGTGTFTTAHAVTITDATSGTTIYYTTNGSTPTTSSTKYTGPVTVSKNETIKAIAVSGSTQSAVASATYEITKNVPTPTFTPAAGTYTKTQSVTITDLTRGATIYYTTNGSTPTTSSTKYTGAITVSSTKTIKALGVASGYGNSPVATATYTIK